MKKLYAIADCREKIEFVTDPICLSNDVQASIAFVDYQRNLLKQKVIVSDLRLYKIAEYEENSDMPIREISPIQEIPVNLSDEDSDSEVENE